MPDYSLVPVDHQPDFDDYSLVPVDHDPFVADGVTQLAQFQQSPRPTQPAQPQPQTQLQQSATGAGQPGVNGPATGSNPSGSGGVAGVGYAGSDPNNPTWAQGWSIESSPFGGNPTPTQPLTDDQLNLIRQKIVDRANAQIGSTAWTTEVAKGNFPEGKNKCNLFVHEMLTDADASPGLPNGHWYWKHFPPTAGQWADPSYAIPGWRVLGPDESPQPGDVAAQPRDYSDATGHVVIVGPHNTFIGVGSPPYAGAPERIESGSKKDIIVRAPAKGPILYRRYVGQ